MYSNVNTSSIALQLNRSGNVPTSRNNSTSSRASAGFSRFHAFSKSFVSPSEDSRSSAGVVPWRDGVLKDHSEGGANWVSRAVWRTWQTLRSSRLLSPRLNDSRQSKARRRRNTDGRENEGEERERESTVERGST